MALPIIAGVGGIAALGGFLYYLLSDDDNSTPKPPSPKPDIIFLAGETGVGKDTISGILKDAKFIEEHIATAKVHKGEPIDLCGYKVCIYNTGGADEQAWINNEVKRELLEKLTHANFKVLYTYVFDANVYFNNSKKRELINLRLNSAKKFTQQFGFELRIIGTHRDMAQKYENKMNELKNELRGKYGVCEIYDLTQAKMQGKQMQRQLFDFIIKGQ